MMLLFLSLAVAQTEPTPPSEESTPPSDEPTIPTVPAPVLLPSDGVDPHLWLEGVEDERALGQVRLWNQATMRSFRADSRFETLTASALQILSSDERLALGTIRGDYVYGHWQSPENVRGLWRRARVDTYIAGTPAWETLLDIDALASTEDENWIWHGAFCAPKSDRCIIELSRGGKDAGVFREFSTLTKQFIGKAGFNLPEAKSEVSMIDEDHVLVATDFGPGTLTESGYPLQVAEWSRGTTLSSSKKLLYGSTVDVSAGAFAMSDRNKRYRFLERSRTFYESDRFVLDKKGNPVQLPIPGQSSLFGLFRGHLVVLVSEDGWVGDKSYEAGDVVALHLRKKTSQLVYRPAEGVSVEQVAIAKRSLLVQTLQDVEGRLERLRWKRGAWTATEINLPEKGQVRIAMSSESREDAFVTFESLTQPVTLFHIDAFDRADVVQQLPSTFDADDVAVEQRFATSTDGTRVPYFVMGKRSVLDGPPAPTIQYGYGGFTIAILPTYFEEAARPQHGAFAGPLWVEAGGILVLSNIRGGSEYGPMWHQSVQKHDRQKAYDDFFAIGQALVDTKVTTPSQLGAIGRSNGGLLMGVAFTQRPDLYAAIDVGVPLLDMMRYDKLLAGASWVGEYGDPDVPEERESLLGYSPYQNLSADTDYPSVLFYTSTRDDRVHPGHARKMAAALESLEVPFHYWENIEGGHGGVANQEQAAMRLALEFLFFKQELGLD